MPGTRPIAMVTALCLILLAWPVWAHPPVMVWPAAPDAPVVEAEAALRGQGVPVISRAPLREALDEHRGRRAERDEERRRGVEAALATAQEHYLSLRLTKMIDTLQGAQADAIALAGPGRCDGLWELQFRLGLALGLRGRTEGGAEDGAADRARSEARYELALALDPPRRPLAELYGPDVTAAFLAAVQRRSDRMPRPVPLQIQPADARVEIDCREHGEGPVDLRPGLHVVRVNAPGYASWAKVVDLRQHDALEVTLTALPPQDDPVGRLAASTDADPQPSGSSSARAAVWAVAHAQGAAAVLVVDREAEGFLVRPWGRYGIGSAVRRAELSVALSAALGLLDDEGRLVAPRPVVDGPVDVPSPPGTRARKPVLRTWWFWTIVGSVVVAGVAVGLGVGLRPSSAVAEPVPGQLIVVAK